MKEFFIGEVLKKRRIELGLTQEQVCEGIFSESSTLSRIENGVHTPSRRKLAVLLQRLGLPEERYYALVDKNELEISELQAQIVSCQVRGKFQEGLEKLIRYEQITSSDDILAQQFLLSSKAILGKYEQGQHVLYTFDQQLDMLFRALRITVPNFDINNIDHGLYCIDEIKIINQIAFVYSNAAQRNIAIEIYSQLFDYVQNHLRELNQTTPIIILIAYNYSLNLCQEKQLNQALEIADLGRRISIETGRSSYFGGLLYILADCLYHLGKHKESRQYFYKAYHVYSAMEDLKHAALTQATIKDFFNEEIYY